MILPRSRSRVDAGMSWCAGLLLLLVSCLPGLSYAAEDVRMTVKITRQESAAARPNLVAAMRQAVPLLWDRLIPRDRRGEADNLTGALNMVSRIVPAESTTSVDFSRQAVFDYLDHSHMAYLADTPSFHLVLQMQNSVGLPMHQTEELLEQYAQELAIRWGIKLTESAPELIVDWKWIDASYVQLTIGGDTPLHISEQVRDFAGGDPLEAMQRWLEDVLLEARDSFVSAPGGHQEETGAQAENVGVWLFLDRSLNLGEQIVLEDAIRSDSRVLKLIPHTYSKQRLRYRLVVRGFDTNWISEWFKHRDFQVTVATDGLTLR